MLDSDLQLFGLLIRVKHSPSLALEGALRVGLGSQVQVEMRAVLHVLKRKGWRAVFFLVRRVHDGT
jgi:hypothetical protein